MSVVVSGSVFWQLRGIGTAMTNYGLPSYDDSGGTALPLSNPSDLETAEIWEATIPPLSDNAGENLALIAESQLGYKESASDFVHAEDGESHNGYTRYGAWYGNPYGDWNTLFTYFCMNYAGLRHEAIPYGSGCWAWSLELDKAGLIAPVTRGFPKRGDILLIDSDGDGKADTSAIVCGTVEEDEAPGISVIEGDVDGCVAQKFYSYDHEGFVGIVSLDDITPEPPVMNEAPELPTELLFSSESESGIHVEASADVGAFPDDTLMTVYDISQDDAVQAAAGHFGEDELDNISAVAVDITFTSPEGWKVRDNKLFDERFLKDNLEIYFALGGCDSAIIDPYFDYITPNHPDSYTMTYSDGLINLLGDLLSTVPDDYYYQPQYIDEMSTAEKQRIEKILGRRICNEAFYTYCTREEYEREQGISM